ncbi:MAG: pyruvate formate lyase family protein [Clostridia bacterium]
MTERIRRLREYILSGGHHALRRADAVDPAPYRDASLADFTRTALRMKAMLEMEEPAFVPDELIAFTRTLKAAPPIYSPEEWSRIKESHYIHELGNVCNLSPDYEKLIREGLLKQLSKLDAADEPASRAYHEAMRVSICAVLELAQRYAEAARESGLEAISDRLYRVPALGATGFVEALQSLRVLHFAMWCEGDYHNTLGRFDQYMYPYFKKDLDAGVLTEAEALEYLEAFFLACNRDSDLYPGMQQGDNGQSLVLGGVTPDGEEGFNRLSELCLTASEELMVIDPKINLRVNGQTPLRVYEQGTRLTKLGLGFPQYENDDVVIPGLEALGYAPRDARNYVVAACWEFIVPGCAMDIPNIGAVGFAGLVNRVLKEKLRTAQSMDALTQEVAKGIREEAAAIAESVKNLYVIPSPYLSLFFDGCLESGRDISLGNRYNNYGLHGTGLATAADSLAAVEALVFDGDVAPEELLSAMEDNFEGAPELRYRLKNQCPKMGNDDDRADRYAVLLLDAFADAVKGLQNERGGCFRAGTGSAMYYIWHAQEIGATADGRLSEEPLPANYAPALNVKLNGPASILRSFAKPDLKRVINGGPLTIEFHDTVFRTDEAITKVAMLVRSFIEDGGHQLQLNTVNRDRLLDAQQHPENYRNLIVRVWGWSGYFVELDKCYQDHIIARVELQL